MKVGKLPMVTVDNVVALEIEIRDLKEKFDDVEFLKKRIAELESQKK